MAPPGTGLPTKTRARAVTRSMTDYGCWPRSTPWSGTGAASRCSGTGPTSSRPTRRRRNASLAITHCRCYGGTR
ncbi:hypothetical protein G6F59_018280 [Rhizopus arrhizus]|nr:hypothetical protein G6F59_018280 [Rhizopus arrhizus]